MGGELQSQGDNCEGVTGLVLSGGAGRRVAGRDKGLIEWRGQALAARVAQRLAPQVDHLVISCNRNRESYQRLGYPLVTDNRADFQGPLSGIEAAAAETAGAFLAVVACDTPDLPDNLVARLLTPLLAPGGQALGVSFAHDGERDQYLCAVLRTGALATLGSYLDSGGRAVRHWYRELGCVAVDFSDVPRAFANLNRGVAGPA